MTLRTTRITGVSLVLLALTPLLLSGCSSSKSPETAEQTAKREAIIQKHKEDIDPSK